MTVLRIPGIQETATTPSPLEQGALRGRTRVKRQIRVQHARAAESFEDVELIDGDILALSA